MTKTPVNDVALLYAEVEGLARQQRVRYLPKDQFYGWLRRNATFKRAEAAGSLVAIQRNNRKGPWLLHNMRIVEFPDDREPEHPETAVSKRLQPTTGADVQDLHEPSPAAEGSGDTSLKVCSNCKKAKPRTEYYRNPATRDGLGSWCKACTKVGARIAYNKWEREGHVKYKIIKDRLHIKVDGNLARADLKISPDTDTLAIVKRVEKEFFENANC